MSKQKIFFVFIIIIFVVVVVVKYYMELKRNDETINLFGRIDYIFIFINICILI